MKMLDTPLGSGRSAAFLRQIPQVQKLLEHPGAAALLERLPREAVVGALRRALEAARAELMQGADVASDSASLVARAAASLDAPGLVRVINAAGIVLHTNLGRAPLAPEAVAAMAEAAGYSNLEFSLETGLRGRRAPGVETLLCALTGAEAALAVNNGAAAMLLALSALATGGEVVVSRGELIEIGGGFRIPEVIQQGGARLIEVGSTNKTRLSDYAAAITPATRAILKVHPSNFRMVGFTAEADLGSLAALARERGLKLVYDLGGGALAEMRTGDALREPTVRESVAAGADLVAFSGDKLLGGPQAGLIVGREDSVAALRKHPLMRALRPDKISLAALEATLRLHRDPDLARRRIPALRMLAQDEAELQARAEKLRELLAPAPATEIIDSAAYSGGGALPAIALPSRAVVVALPGVAPEELARRLRLGHPAVVGRIADGAFMLDVFTLEDEDLPALAAAVREAST
jgi:L-seryl-tRNA(Ser) seleniumtransferase